MNLQGLQKRTGFIRFKPKDNSSKILIKTRERFLGKVSKKLRFVKSRTFSEKIILNKISIGYLRMAYFYYSCIKSCKIQRND